LDAVARPRPAPDLAAARVRRDRGDLPAVLVLVLAGVLLRAATCALSPNIAWEDETFQAVEQALRLVSGRGLTPWEFQIGARSWILPGLAAPLVAAGRAISGDPRVALGLVAALMIAVSAAAVVCAYAVGARHSRLGGLFAAGLAAGWAELVYYSPHLLPDTLSGALLLAALAAAQRPRGAGRLVWIGFLLGATFVVRVQLAPAIGLVGLMACGASLRARLGWLVAGFAAPVAALGALDWATWGAPFHSLVVYLQTNLGGAAAAFGAAPPLAYLGAEIEIWGGLASALVIGTAALGARKAPGLAAVAAVIVLTFSAIAHKELRFVYPALLLLFVLCGVGTGELAADLARRLGAWAGRRGAPLLLALVWIAASAAVGFGPGLRPFWARDADVLRALDDVNAAPDSCGLGLDRPDWTVTGLSRLRGDLQLYDAQRTPGDAYNRLLRLPGRQRPAAVYEAQGFSLQACYGSRGVCLYRRPGPCAAGRAPLRATTPAPVRATLTKLGFSVY
jgi:hypothetical protein